MSSDTVSRRNRLPSLDRLESARQIMRTEAQAILTLAEQLSTEFCQAVDLIVQCSGNLIVTGMGKAGWIGQKISATFASTGTSSHFLHPGEAVHGDLGRIHQRDLVLALSFSGETQETVQLVPSLEQRQIPLIAITRDRCSQLGRAAQIAIPLGSLQEACSLGLAPSTSTTVMLAVGDALALTVSKMRGFDRNGFAQFHPGGSLGRKLAKVEDVMRTLDYCRIAPESHSVRRVIVEVSRPGRRTGAIMLVNAQHELTGVFTDSDLARMLEQRDTNVVLDAPIEQVMTRRPTTVPVGSRLADAIELLATRKISELPVVDEQGVPVGLIDITDVVSLSLESEQQGACDEPRGAAAYTVRFPQS
jgi:arabinose-5-phosphate isomerase